MTLNHSKTWPVSTMAVVQLRVDPHGRTYSTLTDEEYGPNEEQQRLQVTKADQEIRDEQPRQPNQLFRASPEKGVPQVNTPKQSQNGVVFPLSKKHLELFTKMSSTHLRTTIRSDTVSTILEQDSEYESEGHAIKASSGDTAAPDNRRSLEKFHVLALTRIDENNESDIRNICRRPSIKVDNWDLIFTETNPNRYLNRCGESAVTGYGVKTKPISSCGKHNECRLPDVPLDARKAATLKRHYYPEGGWGWVIVVCSVLVHVINNGIQLSCTQLVAPAVFMYKAEPADVTAYTIGTGKKRPRLE